MFLFGELSKCPKQLRTVVLLSTWTPVTERAETVGPYGSYLCAALLCFEASNSWGENGSELAPKEKWEWK